ncbi:hypothetical protein MA13_contig00006-0170 [Edwardsiella piscicida]|nr:hypothetical protein QY76_04065 [Edwardsiella sp. EA181011]RFT05097.1 hypothetical protein CGL57_02815 [Edwardsiella anguillarum]GAJ67644.1 hypothetical protein MA13_contig00006-0170 [Edwardsiella piscicida]
MHINLLTDYDSHCAEPSLGDAGGMVLAGEGAWVNTQYNKTDNCFHLCFKPSVTRLTSTAPYAKAATVLTMAVF